MKVRWFYIEFASHIGTQDRQLLAQDLSPPSVVSYNGHNR